MAEIIDLESQIILCSAITGTGVNVAPDTTASEWVWYLWADMADLPTDFKSRLRNMAFHKSFLTPNVKFEDGGKVKAKIRSKDAAAAKIAITQKFIARQKIYLMINYHDGTNYVRWPFFSASNTLIYYCQGYLSRFAPKMKPGHVWDVDLQFKEVTL